MYMCTVYIYICTVYMTLHKNYQSTELYIYIVSPKKMPNSASSLFLNWNVLFYVFGDDYGCFPATFDYQRVYPMYIPLSSHCSDY